MIFRFASSQVIYKMVHSTQKAVKLCSSDNEECELFPQKKYHRVPAEMTELKINTQGLVY
jgi:hypothetical protein